MLARGRHVASSPQREAANNNNHNHNNESQEKKLLQKYLTNCKSLYSCIYCRTHLANHDELVSRSFQGNHGRAYLFNSVINVSCGPAVQRELNTGSHAVADIFCSNCKTNLGWKYERAFVETQKYKEGKYIIELAHVVRENRHLELDKRDMMLFQPSSASSASSSSSPSSPQSSCWLAPNTNKSLATNYANHDDDDELLFPIYDDFCAADGLPVGSLSSSMHNRIRRSLYLDSTPYDWKYSATSPDSESRLESPFLADTIQQPTMTLTSATTNNLNQPKSSSLGTSSQASSDSPMSSSSQASSFEPQTKPNFIREVHNDDDDDDDDDLQNTYENNAIILDTCCIDSMVTQERNNDNKQVDESEIQFNFEADGHHHNLANQQQICDQSTSTAKEGLVDENKIIDLPSTSKGVLAIKSDTNSGPKLSHDLSQSNSLCLDDEEFYDCSAG